MKSILVSSLVLFTALSADIFDYADPQPIESFSLYSGKDYPDDDVVNLVNGSSWKIHTDHKGTVGGWDVGDTVQIQVRKSHYWFSRQHKFRILNTTKGQSVKVMILSHSHTPLMVEWASKSHPSKVEKEPVYTYINGHSVLIGHRDVVKEWSKEVELSDGSKVSVKGNVDQFKKGVPVYVGLDNRQSENGPFLITGKKEKAVWTPIVLLRR